MEIASINKFSGGWFIGNFEPSIFRTEDFEVCYKVHGKSEIWPRHYHKIATEINYLIRGKMTLKNKILKEGDVFIIEPMEIADPIFLERCELIVVKTPSITDDKYLI